MLVKEQFGLDFTRLFFVLALIPRYISSYWKFRRLYTGKMTINPCLADHLNLAGDVTSEYFVNDLFVAQKIFDSKPQRHVDIGSRLDGFVAHVAAFREVEIFDIRPITCNSKNIKFNQLDIMKVPKNRYTNYSDSISSLHALEHFGLGRYGDPISAEGFYEGLSNIMSMLKINGIFYLSVPLGVERVGFNSHRIINPLNLIKFIKSYGFSLESFFYLKNGAMMEAKNIERIIKKISLERYVLGTFIMKRTSKFEINSYLTE